MRIPDLTRIVIATRNGGKLREFRVLLAPMKSEVLSLEDASIDTDIEETGSSFTENARLKAISYSRFTRLPVLADDSGLEVTALDGRPGIHSARYAGPEASDADRVRKLLLELAEAAGERSARFVCALALSWDGELLLESEGQCSGIIGTEPRGTGGFGYDPVFIVPELNKTFAELSATEKNLYSHRSRAAASLLRELLNSA